MATPTWLVELARDNPALLGALLGAPVGAGTGALSSEEGAEGRGALGGGALGAGLGAIGGTVGSKGIQSAEAVRNILQPSPLKAAILGATALGVAGGRYGKSELPDWVKQRLAEAKVEKEAESPMENKTMKSPAAIIAAHHREQEMKENREAGETPAVEKKEEAALTEVEKKTAMARIAAFDYGMDVWLAEHGIEKVAFAGAVKEAGLLPLNSPSVEPVENLAIDAMIWLGELTKEAVSATDMLTSGIGNRVGQDAMGALGLPGAKPQGVLAKATGGILQGGGIPGAIYNQPIPKPAPGAIAARVNESRGPGNPAYVPPSR